MTPRKCGCERRSSHRAECTEAITYYYRGPIERGARYEWCDGYSANSENGTPFYPWMTKRECQADAKRQGKRATFTR